MITCCHDCEFRHLGCHATCEVYARQKERIQKEKETRAKIKGQQKLVDDFVKRKKRRSSS